MFRPFTCLCIQIARTGMHLVTRAVQELESKHETIFTTNELSDEARFESTQRCQILFSAIKKMVDASDPFVRTGGHTKQQTHLGLFIAMVG